MPIYTTNYDAQCKFHDSVVADIGEGATDTSTSNEVVVAGSEGARLVCYTAGHHGSSSGTVTFNFVTIGYAGETYPTTATFYTELTLSGTTVIKDESFILTSPMGIYAIKLLSIVNGDATYHIDNSNAYLSMVSGKD